MNVVHFTCWYPLAERPNYGHFIREQVKAMQHHGKGKHVLAAVVIAPGKASYHNTLRYLTEEADGVTGAVLEVHTRFYDQLYNNPPFLLQQFRHLYRHVADVVQPDLLHAHVSYPCAIIVRQLARQLELPYVVSDHWLGTIQHLQQHPLRHMTIKALQSAKAILVPSRFMQQQVQDLGKRWSFPAVQVVPPTVDPSLYPFKPKVEHKRLQLVAMAPLAKSKQLDLLIDAVAKLETEGLACRLTLIGTGKDRGRLEARAADHHAPVRFVGRQTHKQVATHLHDADAALFSSKHEVFGPYLAEALCTGTPVLATALPVWNDILAPGFGFQIQPSVDNWLTALHNLTNSEWDHEGIANFAALRYAPAAVAKLIDEAYILAVK